MTRKLWFIQIPIMIFFVFLYWVSELGVHGRLENTYLRESIYPILSRASNLLTDMKFNLRGQTKPKNKITVVEIDGNSIETYGRWPWHRDLMAILIQKTFEAEAKVVGLDIAFPEPDVRIQPELSDYIKQHHSDLDLNQFESDQVLADLIRTHADRLVLGWASETECQPGYARVEQDCPVKNPDAMSLFPPNYEKFSFDQFNNAENFDPAKTPMISFVTPLANIPSYNAAAKHIGYFNSSLDADGHIRRSNLFAIAKGRPYPSLPLEMARVGLNEKIQLTIDSKERVESLGFVKSGRNIDVTPLGVMQINFRGPNTVFSRVSAVDILSGNEKIENDANPAEPTKTVSELLKDSYVLIGLSALGVFDMRQFPFEANAPGVYGHANILDNLLSGDPLVGSSAASGIVWLYLVMLVGVGLFGIAVERLDAIPALLAFLFTFFGAGYFDFNVLFSRNYNFNTVFLYLELVSVFLLFLSAKYISEERNKKFIRGAFMKYVASDVVDSILKDPKKLSLGGEKRELTILFSDIRGFTSFSEKMDAKALAAFLNDYLGFMTGLVFSNHGTLDKYIGDAIMAFWGAPLNQPKHAYNACHAAMEMLRELEKNFSRLKEKHGIEVEIGIGINSGVVNVGNMGSEQNFEYTVIGDHVNLASRMEGLTKTYRAPIVTSRYTFDCIQSSGESFPHHRILDQVKVKGKKNAVELIQLLEHEYPAKALELFQEGRHLYAHQKWDEAIRKFEECCRQISVVLGKTDGPSEVFIERCNEFKVYPPESDWDGSWEMDTK